MLAIISIYPCNILLLNARSIPGKIDELICISNEAVHEIICITETWLDDVVPNEFVVYPTMILLEPTEAVEKEEGVAICT